MNSFIHRAKILQIRFTQNIFILQLTIIVSLAISTFYVYKLYSFISFILSGVKKIELERTKR